MFHLYIHTESFVHSLFLLLSLSLSLSLSLHLSLCLSTSPSNPMYLKLLESFNNNYSCTCTHTSAHLVERVKEDFEASALTTRGIIMQ